MSKCYNVCYLDSSCKKSSPSPKSKFRTMHATDFSQNESQLSYITPSSKFLQSTSNGRSMKDLEEQLTQLKKENFNLKLRIYFAEERKKILQGVDHTDELVEKIMKLQVEHQNLKTELCDKEDLIVQTAKAMESLEKGHENQKAEMRRLHDVQMKQMQSRIEQLEMDVTYNQFRQETGAAKSHNDSMTRDLQSQVMNLESKLSDSKHLIANLEDELSRSKQEFKLLTNQMSELETEMSSRNSRLGEVYAEAKHADQERRMYQEEVKSLKSEISKLERNLHSKCDELQRAKQNLSCDRMTEDEMNLLKKQLHNQNNIIEQLNTTKQELTTRIAEMEQRSNKDQNQLEAISEKLEEEFRLGEQLRQQNEQLRSENEKLRETVNRKHSSCNAKSNSRPSSPSPPSSSQLFINITPHDTEERFLKLQEEYQQLNHKHNNLYETFNDTRKKLEKVDGEYKKTLVIIRNMVKENKKNTYIIENFKEKLKLMESDTNRQLIQGASGDIRSARGQPEGSNEIREEFSEKDIDLLEKQVLIEDYIKQIQDLNIKLDQFETNSNDNNQMTYMALQLKSKTEEIERLNTELKKRTFNLQELVNTELWQKNKEIEKLMRKLEKKQSELNNIKQTVKEKEHHLLYLQKEMNDIQIDLQIVYKDSSIITPEQKKLFDKLKVLKDNIDCVSEDKDNLLSQLNATKDSLRLCEKQRRESLQACFILNKRLEELADFLESIIYNNESVISMKKKQILKHAVDTSRELTHTFNITFNFTNVEKNIPILPDYSEINFLSESDELADVTLEPEADVEERKHRSIIRKLKTQAEDLRDEVKQKDFRRVASVGGMEDKELSACEAFSEPDLVVSKARMGGVCDSNVMSWPSSDSESVLDEEDNLRKYKGKRYLRSEKSTEYKTLQERMDELININQQLEKEKETLERKLLGTEKVIPSTSVEIDTTESTSSSKQLIVEFNQQKESNKIILNKLEHLESIYNSISNKEVLEVYNESKLKISKLEGEIETTRKQNSEISEKLQKAYVDIKNSEEKNKELKEKLFDANNNNEDNLKKIAEHENIEQELRVNVNELKNELETNKNYCKQLEAELESSKQIISTQKEQFEDLKKNMELLKGELVSYNKTIQTKTEEIAAKNREIDELEIMTEELRSELLNVSSDLDEIKNDDYKSKYESIQATLKTTNDKYEQLIEQHELIKTELGIVNNNNSDLKQKYQLHTAELNENNNNLKQQQCNLKNELEMKIKSYNELNVQNEITKLELKNTKLNLSELKNNYNNLINQYNKTNDVIEEYKDKINELKINLECSNNKIELINNNLQIAHGTIDELKNNLNDENSQNKLLKEEKNELINKINLMENNKNIWEKDINALRIQLKKYRENEELELIKHTELVNEMKKRIDEFKSEKLQLHFEINTLRNKIDFLNNEKEEIVRSYEQKQETVLRQNSNTLQEIQNEMRRKLDSANEKLVKKDDAIEHLEEVYKAREKELRIKYSKRESELKRQLDCLTLNNSEAILERARMANDKLRLQQEMREKTNLNPLNVQVLEQMKVELEKRVNELEHSNNELEKKLTSYQRTFSDEMTSGGEDNYPPSPRRSLCTPPQSPSRNMNSRFSLSRLNGHDGESTPDPTLSGQMLSSLSSTKYLSLAHQIPRDYTSPDLGIDSDHGRISTSDGSEHPDKSNLAKLVEENEQLQKMLLKTRQALESTIKQLAAANRRKCQIERDICKQLHKTQHIIRKARVNIQSTDQPIGDHENDENIDPLAL